MKYAYFVLFGLSVHMAPDAEAIDAKHAAQGNVENGHTGRQDS